jgi:dolichol-phosphate mannosyltransferase
VARQLNLQDDTTTIEQEMIIKTLRLGFRMAEVPAHEYERAHGASHIVLWRAMPRYAFSLLCHLIPSARLAPPAPVAASRPARQI